MFKPEKRKLIESEKVLRESLEKLQQPQPKPEAQPCQPQPQQPKRAAQYERLIRT